MPNITLSIPEKVHSLMRKHREIRWSEVARRALIMEMIKLELVDKIASKSKLTIKDVSKINEKIKKGIHTHFKE